MIRDKTVLKTLIKTMDRIKSACNGDKPSVESVDNSNDESDDSKSIARTKNTKPATAKKATPKKKKLGLASKKQKWSESEDENDESEDFLSDDEENDVEYTKPLVEKVIVKRNPLKSIDNLLIKEAVASSKPSNVVSQKASKPTLVQNIQDIDELLDN